MPPLETCMMTYLFNGLWQVPLVYLTGLGVARLLSPFGPRIQHRLWMGVLAVEVLLPACSADLLASLAALRAFAASLVRRGSGGGEVRVSYGPSATVVIAPLHLPTAILHGLLVVYCATLVSFGARLLWRMGKTRGLLAGSQPLTLTARSLERLRELGEALRPGAVEPPRLRLSSKIVSPSTVGFVRPTLFLPTGFLEEVSPADLDAVFAHELAHMRRRDFAWNVVFEVLALPVAWHPAVWYTQHALSEKREMACDEMAADALSGRSAYARSLLRVAALLFERLDGEGRRAVSTHAIGILDANPLERRIMKLSTNTLRPHRRFVTFAACGLIAVATCGSAMALRFEVGPALTGSTSQASGKGVKIDPEVMAGQVLDKKQPIYPQEAKAHPLSGPVILGAVIGKDGSIEKLTIVKSLREDYDKSAIDAVRNWKYKPYLLHGEPTAVETTITVTYSMG